MRLGLLVTEGPRKACLDFPWWGGSLGICLQGWHQPVGLGFSIGHRDIAKLSVQREKTVSLEITVQPFWGRSIDYDLYVNLRLLIFWNGEVACETLMGVILIRELRYYIFLFLLFFFLQNCFEAY